MFRWLWSREDPPAEGDELKVNFADNPNQSITYKITDVEGPHETQHSVDGEDVKGEIKGWGITYTEERDG